jgi:hypothetical protein
LPATLAKGLVMSMSPTRPSASSTPFEDQVRSRCNAP